MSECRHNSAARQRAMAEFGDCLACLRAENGDLREALRGLVDAEALGGEVGIALALGRADRVLLKDNTTVASGEAKDNKGVADGEALRKALRDIRGLLVVRPHRFADQTEKIHAVIDRALLHAESRDRAASVAEAPTEKAEAGEALRLAEEHVTLLSDASAAKDAEIARLRAALTEVLNLPDHRMAGAWDYRRQVVDRAREALADSRRAEGATRSTGAPENSPGGAVTDGREGEGG